MKPKLLLGPASSGKTERLLETVMWLNAIVLCPSRSHARDLEYSYGRKPAFSRVKFIPCSLYRNLFGKEFDIVCMDEWRECVRREPACYEIIYRGKIQPVLTERLDVEHFEMELLEYERR